MRCGVDFDYSLPTVERYKLALTYLQLLADEVTLIPDGGGERGAAIWVLPRREAVSAFILGTYRQVPKDLLYDLTLLNGQQAIVARSVEGRPILWCLFMAMVTPLI